MNRRLYLLVLLLFTVSALALPPLFQRRLNAPAKKVAVAAAPAATTYTDSLEYWQFSKAGTSQVDPTEYWQFGAMENGLYTP